MPLRRVRERKGRARDNLPVVDLLTYIINGSRSGRRSARSDSRQWLTLTTVPSRPGRHRHRAHRERRQPWSDRPFARGVRSAGPGQYCTLFCAVQEGSSGAQPTLAARQEIFSRFWSLRPRKRASCRLARAALEHRSDLPEAFMAIKKTTACRPPLHVRETTAQTARLLLSVLVREKIHSDCL